MLQDNLKCEKALLTSSGTHALEMAAILADIRNGDEVIMPSYTFVSTANAFVLRGARIVFVDIRPDTMNIDENLLEKAITSKTRAIVVVHYAGVACEMDRIMQICQKNNLILIEDAAHGVYATYKEKYLGTIGDIGCFSFHETKNYISGEGGAILLNKAAFVEKAEIIREKGTNRSKFFRGQVDKYTWIDIGSSYLPSEINAAYLFAQLENADLINNNRLKTWNMYFNELIPLKEKNLIELPFVPDNCRHNGHLFYIKTKNLEIKTSLIKYLKENEILAVFHYIPLHSSPAGIKYGIFNGIDKWTTCESEKILRLPLYYNIEKDNIKKIISCIYSFFNLNNTG
ncbi:MAG: dTDP-4-amino-4,6-dideoxygalactose transaminase [Bacteroidia bacterium]|nr:dTDP-4-amino-4,6-dideoxygalactose transaminase [Bacteroidia bacterium]